MEDRYQTNKPLYMLGLFSLLGCLACIMFCLFVFPFLLMGAQYNVPEIIFEWRDYLVADQKWGASAAAWFIFMCFVIPAIVLGCISNWISNHLDQRVLPQDLTSDDLLSRETMLKRQAAQRESWQTLFKLLLSLALLGLLLWGIQTWVMNALFNNLIAIFSGG